MQSAIVKPSIGKPFLGQWIESKAIATKAATVLLGVGLLSVLAQIAIPLPFTPVPITGQTFGVALLSLLLGRKWGFSTVALYLSLGIAGLPIFAGAAAGLKFASAGYLVGMGVASLVVGSLADRGWSRRFSTAFAACALGSVCVFSFGLLVLSNFVPAEALLVQGLYPFLMGDLVKSSLAATLASRVK